MTACNVLGTECVFPEVEGALALRTLQPLVFAQAGDIDDLARRPCGQKIGTVDESVGRRASASLPGA
jgi:hypothetical protein